MGEWGARLSRLAAWGDGRVSDLTLYHAVLSADRSQYLRWLFFAPVQDVAAGKAAEPEGSA